MLKAPPTKIASRTLYTADPTKSASSKPSLTLIFLGGGCFASSPLMSLEILTVLPPSRRRKAGQCAASATASRSP